MKNISNVPNVIIKPNLNYSLPNMLEGLFTFVFVNCVFYPFFSQFFCLHLIPRLHHKERKHLCNLCGKSFFEKWNLTDHIVAVHQKKKPYVCDKCKFIITYKLRFHKKTFFFISIGGKAFSQKSGLSSHNTFQHPDPNKVLPVVSW